jgi:hypothetical protein
MLSQRVDVRFGSEGDICAATSNVRFTPDSDRKSGHPQTVMSTLPLKADMCSAIAHVGFGPIADEQTERPPRGGLSEAQLVF